MKDKRTYTNLKEHGEDMSHENERVHKNEPREDRGTLDLTFLIEEHKRKLATHMATFKKLDEIAKQLETK